MTEKPDQQGMAQTDVWHLQNAFNNRTRNCPLSNVYNSVSRSQQTNINRESSLQNNAENIFVLFKRVDIINKIWI